MNSESLIKQARDILEANDRGGYTIPTSGLYPYQWNWDSAFSAIGWLNFNPERALCEIDLLLGGQWDNGMIPHILFHKTDPGYFPGPDYWKAGAKTPSSGYSQPPVLAMAVKKIYDRLPGPDIRKKVQDYFPKLMAYHRWFWKERNPTGKGLICILHPWESGRDNLPDWDSGMKDVDVSAVKEFKRKDTQHVNSAMRPLEDDYRRYLALVELGKGTGWNSEKMMHLQPFLMVDVLMTFVLLRANKDLLELAEKLNLKKEAGEIAGWIETATKHYDELWNPAKEAYCTLDLKKNRHVDYVNAGTFAALFADDLPREKITRLCEIFGNWTREARYSVPSMDPADPMFEEKRYWRGPIWLQMNYLIREGFLNHGKTAEAARILNDSRELIQKSGFWEYFSALNGEGLGGGAFSWTAAVYIDWQNTP